jgi:ATP-binding cassette subfamily F protein 3
VLKEAIRAFDGTVIVVSHDRDFLDGLVTTVYEFTGKKARQHLGGIYDFLQHKKIETLAELEIKPDIRPVRFLKPNRSEKLSYEARKEFNRKLKKAEKELAEAEAEIAKIELKIAEMNKLLESPDNSSNSDFIMQYQKKQRELEQRMYEWEILGEEVEKIKNIN